MSFIEQASQLLLQSSYYGDYRHNDSRRLLPVHDPDILPPVGSHRLQKPVACETSLSAIPSARSSSTFNLASARLSYVSVRAAFIAAISSLLNL